MTILYAILYFASVAGFFTVGLLVILRQKSEVYKNFAIFSFLMGVWQLLQFSSQLLASDRVVAVSLLLGSVAVVGFLASYFLFFAQSYSSRNFRKIYVLTFAFVIGLLSLFSTGLRSAHISQAGIALENIDIFYGLQILFAGVCCLWGLGIIVLHLKRATDTRDRRRDSTLLAGIFQAVVLVIGFSIYSSNSLSSQIVVPFACLLAVLMIAYAMIYQSLFDIHFFVIKALTYAASLFLITVFCVLPVVEIFFYLFDFHPGMKASMSIVFTCVLAVYLLQALKQKFDKFTNKFFYRYYYDPQDVLTRLNDALVRTVELRTLTARSSEIIQLALKSHFVHFILHQSTSPQDIEFMKEIRSLGEGDYHLIDDGSSAVNRSVTFFRDRKVAVVIKLKIKHEVLGYILLGYKQSGEIYTDRDKRFLDTAAGEISISLQNALRFEEIERFNETLQQKVQDATRQLRESNRKLKKLNDTKDDFIGMASHQLRTPLTSVKGYLSLVLDGDAGKVTGVQRKLLQQAYTSSQRVIFLIADLLNVSRLNTGKFMIERIPTNLSKMIEDEISQLREAAANRDITVEFEKPAHFPTLPLDEAKTRQVVMNFLDNAIYYGRRGGHIKIELHDLPQSVELKVIDDGIGVPKAEQHQLWTKFYRARNAQRARPDGTGLGLYMARKVVVAQGGGTIFDSVEGKGSTFGFTFPKDMPIEPVATPVGR